MYSQCHSPTLLELLLLQWAPKPGSGKLLQAVMQTHEKIRELLNDERTKTKISLRIYGPKLSLMNVMCFGPSQWVANDQKTKPKKKFNYTPKGNFLIFLVHVTKNFRALDIAGSRHLGKAVNSAPFPIGFLSSMTSLMVSTDTPCLCINTFKPN